jgi:hypothetical protein
MGSAVADGSITAEAEAMIDERLWNIEEFANLWELPWAVPITWSLKGEFQW